MRDKSYNAWVQGQYNCIAFGVALGNAFSDKGKKKAEYPNWIDPMERFEKPKITEDNLEEEFRKKQVSQNAWLRKILKKE